MEILEAWQLVKEVVIVVVYRVGKPASSNPM